VLTWAPRLKVAPPPVIPKILVVPVELIAAFSVKLTSSESPTTALTFKPSEIADVPLMVRVASRPASRVLETLLESVVLNEVGVSRADADELLRAITRRREDDRLVIAGKRRLDAGGIRELVDGTDNLVAGGGAREGELHGADVPGEGQGCSAVQPGAGTGEVELTGLSGSDDADAHGQGGATGDLRGIDRHPR